MDLINYTYDNGHTGTFPLDTNGFSRLKVRPGLFGLDEHYYDDDESGEKENPKEESEEEAEQHAGE